jgi:hypothetical protein
MGFSGGGSNVLKAHTHDGTVAQDGGALDFNNITQSQSSAGDVFYSDGVHLQQLTYPAVPAGETLTAAAASSAPSWTAAAGGAIYEKVGSFTTTASTTLNCDITDITGTDIAGLYMVFNGRWNTGDLKIKFNGTSSTGHSTNGLRMEGNGNLFGYYETDTNGFLLCPSVTTAGSKGTFQIFANLNRLDSLSSFNCQWSGNGTNVESWIGSGYLSDTNVTTITEVNLFKSSGNFDAGCTLDIYKINV